MGITIAGQTAVFLQSLLLGAVLGCFYDLFRITRIAFLMPALLVLIEDLLFFLFSSIALFGFLLENNDGQIRWFILLGVVLGWTVYYFTAGSLGQGVSAAAGMALAGKLAGKDYRVFAILGDGELQEGEVWESAMFSAHYKLDHLCYIIDNNGLQIDGSIQDVCSPYPIDEKFRAFGFEVITIDGHDFDQIEEAVQKAKAVTGRPTAIIAKTVKGKGISFMEGKASWHGAAPNPEQYETAMQDLANIEEVL